jgi:hypothetical protein
MSPLRSPPTRSVNLARRAVKTVVAHRVRRLRGRRRFGQCSAGDPGHRRHWRRADEASQRRPDVPRRHRGLLRAPELPTRRVGHGSRVDETCSLRRARRAMGCAPRAGVGGLRSGRRVHRPACRCRRERLRLADGRRVRHRCDVAFRIPPRHPDGPRSTGRPGRRTCGVRRARRRHPSRCGAVRARHQHLARLQHLGRTQPLHRRAPRLPRSPLRARTPRTRGGRPRRPQGSTRPLGRGAGHRRHDLPALPHRARLPVGHRVDRMVHPRTPIR